MFIAYFIINNSKKEDIAAFKGEGEYWYAELKIKNDKFVRKNGTELTVCEFKIEYKKEIEELLPLCSICYGYEWEQIKGGPIKIKDKFEECSINDTGLLKQKEYISINYESNLNLEYKSDIIKVFIIWDEQEENFEINRVK